MTSPTSGFRRSAIAVTAAAAAFALSACGAGQHSQTAEKAAAVDGGSGTSQNVVVNDFRVVVPEIGEESDGPAQVAFAASFSGPGVGNPEGAALESVTIDGAEATIEQGARIPRDCTLVAVTDEASNPEQNYEDMSPDVAGGTHPCIVYTTVTLPDADDLHIGNSVPGTIQFSGEEPIDTHVAVGSSREAAGEFTRPEETVEGSAH